MRHSVQILCVSDRGGGVCVCVGGLLLVGIATKSDD